ncbi:hypothetical protein JCM1841_005058 [Sporobolomyces salmonicolor]
MAQTSSLSVVVAEETLSAIVSPTSTATTFSSPTASETSSPADQPSGNLSSESAFESTPSPTSSLSPPSPDSTGSFSSDRQPFPSASITEDIPLSDIPTVPEFLSFNEWRERYVVLPDPSLARRAKKAAQRVRQDVAGAAAAGAGGAAYDGDGADLGSLFARSEEAGNGQGVAAGEGAGSSAAPLEAGTGVVQHKLPESDDAVPRSNTEAPSASTLSPVQPLPNVGTGDPTDPLLHLKDRSNYAAFECAAMVHRSSRQSKGASSILVEKKDRYMLTPCAAEPKFVEVELCDEIQIDTIVLANFEFFSSMFKHFKASCSVNYPGAPEDWHDLGTFRARNVRGIQVFRPNRIPHFCRYIRVNFLSHFGSEYYCPVSLLRVYGYTQLDAYRESERKAKAIEEALAAAELIEEQEQEEQERERRVEVERVEQIKGWEGEKGENGTVPAGLTGEQALSAKVANASPLVEVEASAAPSPTPFSAPPSVASPSSPPAPSSSGSESDQSTATTSVTSSAIASSASSPSFDESTGTESPSPSSFPLSSLPQETALSPPSSASSHSSSSSAATPMPETTATPPALSSSASSSSTSLSDHDASAANVTQPLASSPSQQTTAASSSAPSPSASRSPAQSETSIVVTRPQSRNDSHASPGPAPPLGRPAVLPPPIQQPQPGESIYGTIMKRLTSLEHNQTLSMHFIEAQSSMLREAFGRIERRLSEVEGTRNRQEQGIRQALRDLEEQRVQFERERLALTAQVSMLTQEVRFDKRLGIVQLVGLLVIVIFVGFTRSIPTSPFLHLASAQAQRYVSAKREGKRKEKERERSDSSGAEVSRKAASHRTNGGGPMSANRHTNGGSAKRYPSISKPGGPRRHYGPLPSSSSRVPALGKAPRPWTPPTRHSSAPPEEAFVASLSSALEGKEAAMRRRIGNSKRGVSPYDMFEFPPRSRFDKSSGLAIDTSPERERHHHASTSVSPLPPHSVHAAQHFPTATGLQPSTADEADTEPSDDNPPSIDPATPATELDIDVDHEPGYNTCSSADDEDASSIKPLTASKARVRPPKPQIVPRPATSMGIPFRTATEFGPRSTSAELLRRGIPIPSPSLPSPPPEPPASLPGAPSSGKRL